MIELNPDKQIPASKARFAFLSRMDTSNFYIDHPFDFTLPLVYMASAMKPNYSGPVLHGPPGLTQEERSKKDILNRGEVVVASDGKLYLFMGALCAHVPLEPDTPEKQLLPDVSGVIPSPFAWMYKERGSVRALLWRGGTHLYMEVRATEMRNRFERSM